MAGEGKNKDLHIMENRQAFPLCPSEFLTQKSHEESKLLFQSLSSASLSHDSREPKHRLQVGVLAVQNIKNNFLTQITFDPIFTQNLLGSCPSLETETVPSLSVCKGIRNG